MRTLVLCQSCKRHVKASEAQCPFCSAAVVVRSQGVAVARGRTGGRAALFLAGTVLAAGCGEEPESDAGRDSGTAVDGGARDASVPRRDGGRDAGILVAQPYGIAIDRGGRDASVVTPRDAGPDCPQVGNLPVPVYGIGIDFGSSEACTDDADAGADAGADGGSDAGTDAGRQMMPVPPYGIAID